MQIQGPLFGTCLIMETRMKKVTVVLAVSAAFMSAGAWAQLSDNVVATESVDTPTVLAAAPAGEATERARPAPRERAFRMPSERVEARLAYARTALKITDAQQPQWNSFSEVLRTHARTMDARIGERRAQMQSASRTERVRPTAIERMERTQRAMEQRSARLAEVIAAAKPLYATFSPEQRQVADQLLAQSGRGGHKHGHGGHRHGHHGKHHGA